MTPLPKPAIRSVSVGPQADREATVALFLGSTYDFLQLIKTREPAEVASYLAQDRSAAAAAAVMMFGMVI